MQLKVDGRVSGVFMQAVVQGTDSGGVEQLGHVFGLRFKCNVKCHKQQRQEGERYFNPLYQ